MAFELPKRRSNWPAIAFAVLAPPFAGLVALAWAMSVRPW